MEADRLDAVALITGAGSGIGAACARESRAAPRAGSSWSISTKRRSRRVADDLEQHNVAPERVSTLAFDVADQDRWAQAAEFIDGQYGRLDWAVVNAGVVALGADRGNRSGRLAARDVDQSRRRVPDAAHGDAADAQQHSAAAPSSSARSAAAIKAEPGVGA